MKAAIVNPYLDTLGGGERYTMSFAKLLVKNGFKVDVEWNSREIKSLLEKRFGKDFSGINFVSDVRRGDGYDLCFWVSDGSIPSLLSRINLLHFQVPFHNVGGKSLINKMKLIRVDKVICNSEFTKNIVDKEYGIESVVVYPPVSTNEIKSKRKKNIILFVGRFSQALQSKHQDILVKVFKRLVDGGMADWKLIIAGGMEIGVGDYVEKLQGIIGNYPIDIVKSPSFEKLKELYGCARIFWSASGYNEDETKNPEKVEHFGITVVEAMSAGAVPILYKAGGHKEIVNDGVNGFLWDSMADLVYKTKLMINDFSQMRKIAVEAKASSNQYSEDRFEDRMKPLINI